MEWLTSFLGWLAGPFSSMPAGRRRFWLLVTLNVLIVLVGTVGLWFVNNYTGLDRVLRTRWLGLHRAWLPLCFLAGYALFWLFWGLWRLLGPDRKAGEFDDLERAWADARAQLDVANIGLNDVPLYLVLGRAIGGPEAFFGATRQAWQVRNAPSADAPLHVWANREAIFVSCEDASLLSLQATRFEEASSAPPPPSDPVELLASVGAEQSETAPVEAPIDAPQPQRLPARGVMLLGEPEPAPGEPTVARRPALIRDEEKVDLHGRRLRHVCRLLLRDRRPFCPVNGLVILVPLAATDSAAEASETAEVGRADVHVARQSLQLDCPVVAVLCDADRLPGFVELASHFPESANEPTRVLGQHFPVLPDLPAGEVPAMIEGGMGWVANDLLPLVVAKLWRREGEEGVPDRTTAVSANMRLYGLLNECRERLVRLGHLVARTVSREEGPPLLAGCYVAGTGRDAREQAFLGGVIRKLLEHQDDVAWAPGALAEDTMYRWYAFVGYVLLAGLVVGVVALLVVWW